MCWFLVVCYIWHIDIIWYHHFDWQCMAMLWLNEFANGFSYISDLNIYIFMWWFCCGPTGRDLFGSFGLEWLDMWYSVFCTRHIYITIYIGSHTGCGHSLHGWLWTAAVADDLLHGSYAYLAVNVWRQLVLGRKSLSASWSTFPVCKRPIVFRPSISLIVVWSLWPRQKKPLQRT